MEASEYENIYENEGRHFFYRANHNIFLSYVASVRKKLGRPLKILDAGCGTGLLAKKLKKFGDVIGVDVSPRAIYFSRKRGITVKLASINKLPFKPETFDIATSMDVLYHKNVNDKRALSEIYRVLKPGGLLLLRVPANPILFSLHDRFVHTRERYTKKKLLEKLKSTGFQIQKLTFVNSFLFVPALFKALFEKFRKTRNSSSITHPPELINKFILQILLFENLLTRHISLPFGIGLFAVAKKPDLSYNQKKHKNYG